MDKSLKMNIDNTKYKLRRCDDRLIFESETDLLLINEHDDYITLIRKEDVEGLLDTIINYDISINKQKCEFANNSVTYYFETRRIIHHRLKCRLMILVYQHRFTKISPWKLELAIFRQMTLIGEINIKNKWYNTFRMETAPLIYVAYDEWIAKTYYYFRTGAATEYIIQAIQNKKCEIIDITWIVPTLRVDAKIKIEYDFRTKNCGKLPTWSPQVRSIQRVMCQERIKDYSAKLEAIVDEQSTIAGEMPAE